MEEGKKMRRRKMREKKMKMIHRDYENEAKEMIQRKKNIERKQ